MTDKKITMEQLASFCKQKGIIFPAAEIYGGISGFFDVAPLGVEIQNNMKSALRKEIIHKREDMVEQDGSIITNPKVWKASGHVDGFGDLILTTKDTKTKLRADHFIEDELNIPADGMSAKQIQELIDKHDLTYKGEKFEEIKDFNLLFATQVGADQSKENIAYLRGETCQSIFPNFKLITEACRKKLPYGIMQVGKAFRNEISPRDFLFRCREFEQLEIEYFFNPNAKFDKLTEEHLNTKFQFLSAETQEDDTNKMTETTIKELVDSKKMSDIHGYWMATMFKLLQTELGLKYENLRVRQHVSSELSHYSAGTFDIDYNYPHGFKEMLGMANRTNFDLTQHQNHSGSKLEYFDQDSGERFLPHVIEPSLGVGRALLAILYEAYTNDEERGNIVLKLPKKIAPCKVSVFPLIKKPEFTSLAKEIKADLVENDLVSSYDKSGSIGKRYARADEIGTPYCITVDHDSLESGIVTIRDRDTTEQVKVHKDKLAETIRDLVNDKVEFSKVE
ncbi:glycine--tRNA ligase [Methanococcoides sp. SA1]|nr:glycine--tRNA ligase [Methanococcoides sp. SA1]